MHGPVTATPRLFYGMEIEKYLVIKKAESVNDSAFLREKLTVISCLLYNYYTVDTKKALNDAAKCLILLVGATGFEPATT